MNRSYILALCLLPTASLCMMDRFKLRSAPKPPRFKLQEKPFETHPLLTPNIQEEYDVSKEVLDKARKHNPADYLKMGSRRTEPYYQFQPLKKSYFDHLKLSIRVLFLPCIPQSEDEINEDEPAGSL